MNTQQLRQKILGLAIRGKLVTQDPNDEPATSLLARINPKARPITDNLPFQVPENWCWTKISSLGNIVTGNTPSKSNSDFFNGPIPFYKPTDLEQGINTHEANDTLTEAGFEVSRKLPAGSILITCIGATIGKAGLITKSGACNQQINAIIPYAGIDSKYVYYLSISSYLQSEIKSNASATTLPILNKNKFGSLLVPLPPLSEQRRIVAAVEEYFHWIDIIEQNQSRMQATIDKAKAKILDLAVNGELVRKNEEWKLCKLSDIGNIVSGGTPSTSNPDYWADGDVAWITPADLSGYKEMYIARGSKNITQEGLNHSSATLMPAGSVIMSTRAPIGYVAIAANELSTNQGFKSIVPYEKGSEEYLYYFCKANIHDFEQRASGTTFKELSKRAFADTQILYPPLSVQQEIVSRVKSLFSVLDRIAAAV